MCSTTNASTTLIEIGSLREPVELVEAPEPRGRPGRIRHANGEWSEIDHETLRTLRERARAARSRAVLFA